MRLPAWYLLDADKALVASCRAPTAEAARKLFKDHGLSGSWVRKA